MQLLWSSLFLLAAPIFAHPHPARDSNEAEITAPQPTPAAGSELADIHTRELYNTAANLFTRHEAALQSLEAAKEKRALETRDQATLTCPECDARITVKTSIRHGQRYCNCSECYATLRREADGTWVHEAQTKRSQE